jgi:hypothetical protein
VHTIALLFPGQVILHAVINLIARQILLTIAGSELLLRAQRTLQKNAAA